MPVQPKKGERFTIRSPFTGSVLTQWAAPCTDGRRTRLPIGLEFVVDVEAAKSATAICVLPDPYDAWEEKLVSREDRAADKYSGYYLVVSFDDLDAHCEPKL